MKKTLGIIIVFIWVSFFFYFYNRLMPKGILFFIVAVPIITLTTLFILKKSGFKI